VERRPIIYAPVGNLSYRTQDAAIPKIAHWIKETETRHAQESGVIHLTYGLATKLRNYMRSNGLDAPNYLWHDKNTRGEVYERFLSSPPGTVLFACGLYEGIDLKNDLARWQALCKIPWPSLADAAISHKAATDEEWYANQTLKTVMQFAGRVCRTPTDYGTSYILDTSWERLRKSASHLMPRWFTDAFQGEE
jgi:Rad3-related DNA helicase